MPGKKPDKSRHGYIAANIATKFKHLIVNSNFSLSLNSFNLFNIDPKYCHLKSRYGVMGNEINDQSMQIYWPSHEKTIKTDQK